MYQDFMDTLYFYQKKSQRRSKIFRRKSGSGVKKFRLKVINKRSRSGVGTGV